MQLLLISYCAWPDTDTAMQLTKHCYCNFQYFLQQTWTLKWEWQW